MLLLRALKRQNGIAKADQKNPRKSIEDGTAKNERWIQVNLPCVDEHIMHPTGDVSSRGFSCINWCFVLFTY